MLMSELKLIKEVSDSEGISFTLEFRIRDGKPLLGTEVSFWDNTIYKAVDTTPEQLEELADTFQDWADQLRRYQSQRLANNLFEGD